ncbi:ABC-type transport auxiliary lipoprotein family protein [Oceanibium sediminis]|uniref:ABC-type transport auxiliary lipoprotein family protein n=1 Tax=Oceanibium sediminis TaxID=2026339 RepID=UPI000DD35C24|nr:ABC-type transport auxiliary lipoprotein family protein [Oceanibium sediminis]
MRLRALPAALLMILAVPGCSAISSLNSASQPLEIYEISTPAIQPAATRRNIELIVEEPSASGALATERIMIRPAPLQAQYLPGVRWSDPAPVMLQTQMLRGLSATGALGSVGRRPVGTSGDYAVLSELTDFQAESTGDGDDVTIRVRLMVRLVREQDAQVIATRTFEVTEAAASSDPGPIVEAFDRAAGRLLGDVMPWVLRNSGAAS